MWPMLFLGVILIAAACAGGPEDGVQGPYQSWDEVIARWIGKPKADLLYELGPPNLHPLAEQPDGSELLAWDMTIDRMPGQADEYRLLPLTLSAACRLYFLADPEGIVRSGRREGCD
jgi:hypothetical protein